VDETAPVVKASGVYTWVITTDTVYVDSLAAESFGFAAVEGKNGLPLLRYIERVHADDRPRVAKSIHDTMLTGNPFCEQYRVCRPDGSVIEVIAFGSCFRDASGEPSHYSGMVFPKSTIDIHGGSIIGHLLAAYDAACREGRPELAGKIIDALSEAGWRESDVAIGPRGIQLH
jgi:PAS domain-containing protein